MPHRNKARLWNRDFIMLNIGNFMLFFAFYLLMPLLPLYLSEQLHADKQMIGLVLSGFTVAALVARMFSGYFVDTHDRKRFLVVVYGLFFLCFGGYFVSGSLLFFALLRTLHGLPFGGVTVANSTLAIDVLDSTRRAEGIGYYGLSNNLATALAPMVAVYIYTAYSDFDFLFFCAFLAAGLGFATVAFVKGRKRPAVKDKAKLSWDRLFLTKGWREGLVVAALSFSYGILSTYLAIYGKEELGLVEGTGTYFLLLAGGLIVSRIIGGPSLGKGHIVQNASGGMVLSLLGYTLFAAVSNPIGYYGSAILIGLGNGHMFPAMQTMFINLARSDQRGTANASVLTSWDIGLGVGVLAGGAITELTGYHVAFWVAAAINAVGVLFFFMAAKGHFSTNKLR